MITTTIQCENESYLQEMGTLIETDATEITLKDIDQGAGEGLVISFEAITGEQDQTKILATLTPAQAKHLRNFIDAYLSNFTVVE